MQLIPRYFLTHFPSGANKTRYRFVQTKPCSRKGTGECNWSFTNWMGAGRICGFDSRPPHHRSFDLASGCDVRSCSVEPRHWANSSRQFCPPPTSGTEILYSYDRLGARSGSIIPARMINFCSETGCRQEAKYSCNRCLKVLCPFHMCWSLGLAGGEENLARIQAVVNCYLDEDERWSGALRGIGRTWPHISGDYEGRTYKAYFTSVEPRLRESLSIQEEGLCWNCGKQFVRLTRERLLTNFLPLLERARRQGELCNTDNSKRICVFDADTHCSKCGRPRCREHAAACEQCLKILCCDIFFTDDGGKYGSSYYSCEGGCAAKHRHGYWETVLSGKGGMTFQWKRV
jgi:hypothetical protein